MLDGRKLSLMLKKKKIKSEDVVEKLKEYNIDLSLSSIKQYRIGNIAPPLATVEALAHILDCSELDLMENSKEKKAKVVIEELKNNLEDYLHLLPQVIVPSNLKSIPFIRGYPTLSANDIVEEQSVKRVKKVLVDISTLDQNYKDENLEALTMVGDSMETYLSCGDIAICYPTTEFRGAGKYVIEGIHGLELRSISFLLSGDMVLGRENNSYPTETVLKENVDIIEIYGLIVGRIRKG